MSKFQFRTTLLHKRSIMKFVMVILLLGLITSCSGGSPGGPGKSFDVKLSPEGTSFTKGAFTMEAPPGAVNAETSLKDRFNSIDL